MIPEVFARIYLGKFKDRPVETVRRIEYIEGKWRISPYYTAIAFAHSRFSSEQSSDELLDWITKREEELGIAGTQVVDDLGSWAARLQAELCGDNLAAWISAVTVSVKGVQP
jgi:hypothetical protein